MHSKNLASSADKINDLTQKAAIAGHSTADFLESAAKELKELLYQHTNNNKYPEIIMKERGSNKSVIGLSVVVAILITLILTVVIVILIYAHYQSQEPMSKSWQDDFSNRKDCSTNRDSGKDLKTKIKQPTTSFQALDAKYPNNFDKIKKEKYMKSDDHSTTISSQDSKDKADRQCFKTQKTENQIKKYSSLTEDSIINSEFNINDQSDVANSEKKISLKMNAINMENKVVSRQKALSSIASKSTKSNNRLLAISRI